MRSVQFVKKINHYYNLTFLQVFLSEDSLVQTRSKTLQYHVVIADVLLSSKIYFQITKLLSQL